MCIEYLVDKELAAVAAGVCTIIDPDSPKQGFSVGLARGDTGTVKIIADLCLNSHMPITSVTTMEGPTFE